MRDNLEPLGVDFVPRRDKFEPLGVYFGALRADLGFLNQYWLHDVDVGHLVGNFGSLELDFKSLGISSGV